MKIIVSGYVGKKITGIGRNLICLLDNANSNNKYIIYTNEDMKDSFQFSNPNVIVKTYKISKNSSLKNLLWTTFIFPLKAAQERADRALIPNFTLLLFKYCSTFVIMHDLIEFNVPDKFSKKKMFYRTKLADPITAKRANRIITVSENSKRDIIKFLNVPNDKIHVIYNGVDQKKFRKMNFDDAANIIKNKKWPSDYILYAGTIDHPGKNAMGVIKAFEQLKEEGSYSGYLILAGMPGANYETVNEYVARSKYNSDIVLTGFVTDEELVALYSLCRVFVFISLYEGFGIPPLEALSCGAKVVVSNNSSLPEVVGDIGWTVDPLNEIKVKDTVKQVIGYNSDDIYRKKKLEHLKKYDWNDLGTKFDKVISGE